MRRGHITLLSSAIYAIVCYSIPIVDAVLSKPPLSSCSILVAGSLNVDTFLPIPRFPCPGENLMLLSQCHDLLVDVPGGKGCNQAIACSKLSDNDNEVPLKVSKVFFLGRFGNDAAADVLRNTLLQNHVDISLCKSSSFPSGRGYVMLVPSTGQVSAVVSGGSNLHGWGKHHNDEFKEMLSPHSLLLLQSEIPEIINLQLAAVARNMNIPVILDVGGEDRGMNPALMEYCNFLIPNETEIERLAKSYRNGQQKEVVRNDRIKQRIEEIQAKLGPILDLSSIMENVQLLQSNGANNVLVTLGSHGSILVRKCQQLISSTSTCGDATSNILYENACPLPPGLTVLDETGAGDCYRAAFSVALLEYCGSNVETADTETLQKCMKFASAAGALAVTKKGAVPSIPSRNEVMDLLDWVEKRKNVQSTLTVPRGGKSLPIDNDLVVDSGRFPFKFASRLNSMKDRQDLLDPTTQVTTPRELLLRQANIRGLDCVDFNYPQHFHGYWSPEEAKQALDEVQLVAGAVCLRYPSKFARGAMNHPDPNMRKEAIELTKDAAKVARILGCNEVVVWSAYDGYDYPFQVTYKTKWNQLVESFRECCDAYPDIKWSLEFKPTDENTRFFTVPSTGAAMLLVNEVDRPNMGLTLDMGHMLMAGENPGQSIAMVGDKLFGIQMNDGYTRLAAEDGMMFGSIHPSVALEVLYQLRINKFQGHLYFDTFPQRTDPVLEAEYNIKKVKEFWNAVEKMDLDVASKIASEHDAIGALELVNNALRG